MIQSVQWIEHVIVGDVALGLCVIAVAVVGAVMLGGRLSAREGMRIVLGLFVVLSAPVIAGGFSWSFDETFQIPLPQPVEAGTGNSRSDLPPADYDPYAGASLGN